MGAIQRAVRAQRLLPWSALIMVACGGIAVRSAPPVDGGVPASDAAEPSSGDSSTPPASDASDFPPPDAQELVEGGAGDAQVVDCVAQGPIALVAYVDFPRELAVDATNLYFSALDNTAESDAIYQIAKGAVGATPLQLSDPDRQPYSLATDGTYLYWNDTLDPGSIRRIRPGGAGEATLLDVGVWGVALSPSSLFWVTFAGDIQSMPKGGGSVTTLGTAPGNDGNSIVYAVAIDTSRFYFVETSSLSATIASVPLSGGPAATLATVTSDVTTIATDGQNLFYVSGDALTRVPVAGGTPSVVANGFSGTITLAVDSGNVYATTSFGNGPNGSVLRVAAAGGTPTVIASSQFDPAGIVLDDRCVYWADSNLNGGSIMMAAK